MSVKPLGARDHRIDTLRGLALVSIFINHIPGNVLEPFTHKNFGLSDSAELFVLLAGIAAAFAYWPTYSAGHRLLASGKAVKRAGTLYVAHSASILVGIAIFSFGARVLAEPSLLAEINIPPLLADPVGGLMGLAALTHQLGYHNILPMYVCLLLVLPALLALAAADIRLMVLASVAVYALTQVFGWNLPNYPTEGGWFFNPFAWQIIFMAGLFAGMRILAGKAPVPYWRPLWWAALAYLVATLVYHRWNLYGTIPDLPFLPHNFQINEKPLVAAPRLAHILALAYVIGHSRIMHWLAAIGPGSPLALMGRHALPVFWLGTALSMVGQVTMRAAEPGAAAQLALLAVGIALQVGLALALDRIATADSRRRAERRTAAPTSPPPPATVSGLALSP